MRHGSLALVFCTAIAGLALTTCGGEEPVATGSGGGLTIGPGPGSGGSGNGSSSGVAGSSSASASASSSSGGPCFEEWICGPWDAHGTNAATRTCTDTQHCNTTNGKPIETATLPALDENYFRCNVTPILDAKCSQLGCHGTESGRQFRVYARGKLRPAGVPLVAPLPPFCDQPDPLDGAKCIGKLACECLGPHVPTETQRNFDAARGFAIDDQGNPIPQGMASTSDLIQQPVVGGKSHAGVHLFKPNDAEYSTIVAWLSGATLASCNPMFD